MQLIEAIQELMNENREPTWSFKAAKDTKGALYELNMKTIVTAEELVSIVRTLEPQMGLFESD